MKKLTIVIISLFMMASLGAVPFKMDHRNNNQKVVFQKTYSNPHVRKDIGSFFDKGYFNNKTDVKRLVSANYKFYGGKENFRNPHYRINTYGFSRSACIRAHGGRNHNHCLPIVLNEDPLDEFEEVDETDGETGGETGIKVPDSGATFSLLALGLAALGVIKRRKKP